MIFQGSQTKDSFVDRGYLKTEYEMHKIETTEELLQYAMAEMIFTFVLVTVLLQLFPKREGKRTLRSNNDIPVVQPS